MWQFVPIEVRQAIDPAAGLFTTMQEIKWLSVYKILGKSEVLYMARMVLCKTQHKMLGCLTIGWVQPSMSPKSQDLPRRYSCGGACDLLLNPL